MGPGVGAGLGIGLGVGAGLGMGLGVGGGLGMGLGVGRALGMGLGVGGGLSWQLAVDGDAERQALGLQGRPHHGRRIVDDRSQVRRLGHQLKLARLQLRVVQHVVDDPLQEA